MYIKFGQTSENGVVSIQEVPNIFGIIILDDEKNNLQEPKKEEVEDRKCVLIDGKKYISTRDFYDRNTNLPIKERSLSSFISRCMNNSPFGWRSLNKFLIKKGKRIYVNEKEFLDEFNILNNKHRRFVRK